MGRIWVAVICVLLLVAVAAGAVFFATVGSSMVSNGLAALAARSGPGGGADPLPLVGVGQSL